MPENPYGAKPPVPKLVGTSEDGMLQFDGLALRLPAMITNKTTAKLRKVNMLLTIELSFAPNAMANENKIVTPKAKKSGNSDKPCTLIGMISVSVSCKPVIELTYVLKPLTTLAEPGKQ